MGKVKILDGGFATQIQNHVKETVDGHPLWVCRFMLTDRSAVVKTHRDFVRVGSNIIRTCSYQSSIDGFVKHMGLTHAEAEKLIEDSVHLAKEAIKLENKMDGEVLVAGSVGPYGASLHDGSEYTGSYVNQVTIEQLKDWHRPRMNALIKSGCDLIAFETIPCSKEALALIELIKEFPNIKAWLSFSLKDERSISDGESFSEVVKKCWGSGKDRLIGVGVNCVSPKLITPLFKEARNNLPNVPLVVYPNSGETYNKQLEKWERVGEIKPIHEFVDDWLSLGVEYIGTCCRTTVNDLADIYHKVKDWNTKRE